MVLKHIVGSIKELSINGTATVLTIVLTAIYFGSGKVLKSRISPIVLIGISALSGVLVYGWH